MTSEDRVLGGRYEVGELLGYGGMAEVHHGRDLRLGRDVAIKMLRTDLARDATFQARFRREAQNAASLNHPAIVAVYDTGEEKGANGEALPYIVMEYVSGQTLKEVLTAEGPMAPRRALEITADVCGALEFSHRHGIIHRDIKPGNVMLTSTGQVKVMDFGIARAVAGTTTTMTQTSAVIGTAQYLSPEQARGETVDARSDVYATGCVLFELLTGAPPFTGDSPVSVAYQHVREEPKLPSERNADVPADVDAVVIKALAKNPASRYQSTAEMRADLLRAANGRPVQAPAVLPAADRTQVLASAPASGGSGTSIQPAARVTDPVRRRRAMWVLVSLGLLVVLALTATGIGLYLSSEQAKVGNVPNVKGELVQVAKRKIVQAQFKWELAYHKSTKQQKNRVLDQSPGPGEASRDTIVRLVIGQGPATRKVPPIIGLNGRAAVDSLLHSRNLKGQYKLVDGPGSEGDVLDSDPKPGATVAEGSTVIVYLSRGNQTKVPYVVGRSEEAAKVTLSNAGFEVNVSYEPSDDPDDAGKVIKQDPASGSLERSGSTITITVAQKPSPSSSSSATGSPTPTDSPTNPIPTITPSHRD